MSFIKQNQHSLICIKTNQIIEHNVCTAHNDIIFELDHCQIFCCYVSKENKIVIYKDHSKSPNQILAKYNDEIFDDFDIVVSVFSIQHQALIFTKTYNNKWSPKSYLRAKDDICESNIILHCRKLDGSVIKKDIMNAYFSYSFLMFYNWKIVEYKKIIDIMSYKLFDTSNNKLLECIEGSRRIIAFDSHDGNLVAYNINTFCSFLTKNNGTFFDIDKEIIFLANKTVRFIDPNTMIILKEIQLCMSPITFHMGTKLFVDYNLKSGDFEYYELANNELLKRNFV